MPSHRQRPVRKPHIPRVEPRRSTSDYNILPKTSGQELTIQHGPLMLQAVKLSSNQEASMSGTSAFDIFTWAKEGYRVKVRRITVLDIDNDGGRTLEIYFGDSSTPPSDITFSESPIDVIKIGAAGIETTRTWTPDIAPASTRSHNAINGRFLTNGTAAKNWLFLLEYTVSQR